MPALQIQRNTTFHHRPVTESAPYSDDSTALHSHSHSPSIRRQPAAPAPAHRSFHPPHKAASSAATHPQGSSHLQPTKLSHPASCLGEQMEAASQTQTPPQDSEHESMPRAHSLPCAAKSPPAFASERWSADCPPCPATPPRCHSQQAGCRECPQSKRYL